MNPVLITKIERLKAELFHLEDNKTKFLKEIAFSQEVKKIVDDTYRKAKEILTAKKSELGELARFLLEKEVVEEVDLKKILQLPVMPA